MRITEVFFSPRISGVWSGGDVVAVTQSATDGPRALAFHSQWVDLTQRWSAVEAGMSSTTRYEVRRATQRDRVHVHIDHEPGAEAVARFAAQYAHFAAGKGLRAVARTRLQALANVYALILVTGAVGGTDVVRHAYVGDGERLRLLLSMTVAPPDGVTSRTNRYTHVRAMRWAAEGGRSIFDWGGLALGDPALRGVDQFKQSFGGFRVTEFCHTYPRTPLGWAALWVRQH